MAYQAHRLVERLEAFRSPDYADEAISLAQLIASFAKYVRQQLHQLQVVSQEGHLGLVGDDRARKLGQTVGRLYSYVRYLQGSRHSPPAIQAIIRGLTQRYFPTDRGKPVVLVRPQWAYNLKYVGFRALLRREIDPTILDPTDVHGLLKDADPKARDEQTADRFLELFWRLYPPEPDAARGETRRASTALPEQAAILSFAGLDRNVPFQFPILAHELGHFVDLSGTPEHHRDKRVREAWFVKRNEVEVLCAKHNVRDVASQWESLTTLIQACLKEALADLLGTRMMGLGFALAQADFFGRHEQRQPFLVTQEGYPSPDYRVMLIVDELRRMGGAEGLYAFLDRMRKTGGRARAEMAAATESLLDGIEADVDGRLRRIAATQGERHSFFAERTGVAERAVAAAIPALRTVAAELIPDDAVAVLTDSFFERIEALRADLPPSMGGDTSRSFAEIMSASWIYRRHHGIHRESTPPTIEKRYSEFSKTCRLVLKALELAAVADQHPIWAQEEAKVGGGASQRLRRALGRLLRPAGSGVLSDADVRDRLSRKAADPRRIVVVPSMDQAIQSVSLDVHLGQWFKVARRPRLAKIDLGTKQQQELATVTAHEELFIPFGDELVVHAGDFVLGATLEFVALPNDVMAFVEGKSRLGRTGLIVATATKVDPGFHGCIVLELANTGSVPLVVRPGIAVAQLVLISVSGQASPYDGSSQCQIKP